jgi:toxin-antitoxin system PIN domain toxin
MTLYFLDVNVWMALADSAHSHSPEAWNWFNKLPSDARLIFSRFTQMGLLRLLTNAAVMGRDVHTLRQAWHAYDRLTDDSLVEFYPEPRTADALFRKATQPLAEQYAPKAVGDCWILAFAESIGATVVTFDGGLNDLARKQGHPSLVPA